MSADRWTTCPACENEKRIDADKLESKLHESYGVVSPAEYDNLKSELTKAQYMEDFDKSLREDYEIGIEGGIFEYEYSCHCKECGFSLTRKIWEKIDTEGGKS
tara:strand:+ start:3605 stop:3913 length:309 start_codon:yes stop_codon:yes gene_type:complete